jgi:hypothetical protein
MSNLRKHSRHEMKILVENYFLVGYFQIFNLAKTQELSHVSIVNEAPAELWALQKKLIGKIQSDILIENDRSEILENLIRFWKPA